MSFCPVGPSVSPRRVGVEDLLRALQVKQLCPGHSTPRPHRHGLMPMRTPCSRAVKNPDILAHCGTYLLQPPPTSMMSNSTPALLAALEGLANRHSQGCCPILPELSQGPGPFGTRGKSPTLKLAPSSYSLLGKWWQQWQSPYQCRGVRGWKGGVFPQERNLSAQCWRDAPRHPHPPQAEQRTS